MHGSIFSSLTLRREIGKDTFRLKAKDSSDESSVCLIVPVSEVSSPDKSADLLNMILTLRGLQESNSEEVDEPVVPPTLSQVDNLELKINCISVSLAEIIINSCCNSSLDEISFSITTPAGTNTDGVCTSLTVRKKESTFWLKLMDGRICSSPYTAPALSGISLLSEEIPHDMNWGPLIKAFSDLRSLTTSSPHVDGHLGGVLSLLCNLPKLVSVTLCVSCLSEGLAKDIMSIIEKYPAQPEVMFSIKTPAGTNTDGVCTSLTVRIKESTFWLQLMDGRISSSTYTAPALSGISLLSEEIPHDMNWGPLIRAFSNLRSLTTSSLHVDERVGDVLPLLCNLPKLVSVTLYMSSLSEGLKNCMKSIHQEHPTHPEATVTCGMNNFIENKSEWFSMVEWKC